jgi:transposase
MPKTRLPYAPEFRRQMIELVRAGCDPEDLAREFEPTSQSIRNWVAQADRSEGRRKRRSSRRQARNAMSREVRQLRLERDILSKAAAWFARETGAVSSGSSGS